MLPIIVPKPSMTCFFRQQYPIRFPAIHFIRMTSICHALDGLLWQLSVQKLKNWRP